MANLTIKDALEIAVKTEQLGDKFYGEMSKKFGDNEDLSKVFELLAADEKEHEAQFKALLDKYEDDQRTISDVDQEYLKAVSLEKYFENLSNLDEKSDMIDVLKLAYNVEKEAVLFFSGIRDAIGDDIPELNAIIKIEKGHLTKVMKYIVSDAEFRGISDQWS
jgi:rubrerythrin